jgi:hypothetical protein
VSREPVQYVRNIFKYYTAYSLLADQDRIKQRVMVDTKAEE